jgi:hypothetical protein
MDVNGPVPMVETRGLYEVLKKAGTMFENTAIFLVNRKRLKQEV